MQNVVKCYIDSLIGANERQNVSKTAKQTKKIRYPDDTKGSRWAAENRKKADLLTDTQRGALFHRAIARIYGGARKKAVRS